MSLDTQRPSHPRTLGEIGAGSLQATRKITTSAGSSATGTRRMSFLYTADSIKSNQSD
jgi:hypothetical protein